MKKNRMDLRAIRWVVGAALLLSACGEDKTPPAAAASPHPAKGYWVGEEPQRLGEIAKLRIGADGKIYPATTDGKKKPVARITGKAVVKWDRRTINCQTGRNNSEFIFTIDFKKDTKTSGEKDQLKLFCKEKKGLKVINSWSFRRTSGQKIAQSVQKQVQTTAYFSSQRWELKSAKWIEEDIYGERKERDIFKNKKTRIFEFSDQGRILLNDRPAGKYFYQESSITLNRPNTFNMTIESDPGAPLIISGAVEQGEEEFIISEPRETVPDNNNFLTTSWREFHFVKHREAAPQKAAASKSGDSSISVEPQNDGAATDPPEGLEEDSPSDSQKRSEKTTDEEVIVNPLPPGS